MGSTPVLGPVLSIDAAGAMATTISRQDETDRLDRTAAVSLFQDT
ncbi:hypothetical protein ACFU44_25630 [Nocardia rhizosphaerihabitans]